MAGRGFSVDDAFESDEDEKIRTYGSTTATKAFRGAGKQEKTKEQHEEQSFQVSESGGLLETSPDSPSAKLDLSRLSFADTGTTDDASISVKTFSGNVISVNLYQSF
ncbi:uncharacterized protein LOC106150930 [Lingula anatina]|uniref:Uncharacterized protein LOC106150930 n=1 Tax=Lingula anatina TaxID=7574 RepID=A0A1S3H0F0_LINAN|nr:uncharacterized protein LOC106150930 [Lingula anatina]|eukprot:XP_013379412.1 uncharacterized protein LOC106150930 [Lingula anatina]